MASDMSIVLVTKGTTVRSGTATSYQENLEKELGLERAPPRAF